MVAEFYVNIRVDQPRRRLWVRGVEVPYDAATIRALYNIPEMAGETPAVSYDHLSAMLRAKEGDWENFTTDTVQTFYKTSDRTPPEVKVWNNFICSSILPSTNHHSVPKERFDIIYHILNGKMIDIAEIISQNIYRVREQNTRSNLYPCMITELCVRARVVARRNDRTKKPGRDMGDIAIYKFGRNWGVGHAPMEDPDIDDGNDGMTEIDATRAPA